MRRIPPEHEDWCRALLIQGMLLRATIWYPLMPEPNIKTVVQAFETLKPYYGHSCGMNFHTPSLYWQEIDLQDPELEKKGNQWLLEKMDFPTIALTLSYDMFDPPAKETVGLMAATAPLWGSMTAQGRHDELGKLSKGMLPAGSDLTIASAFNVLREAHEPWRIMRMPFIYVLKRQKASGGKTDVQHRRFKLYKHKVVSMLNAEQVPHPPNIKQSPYRFLDPLMTRSTIKPPMVASAICLLFFRSPSLPTSIAVPAAPAAAVATLPIRSRSFLARQPSIRPAPTAASVACLQLGPLSDRALCLRWLALRYESREFAWTDLPRCLGSASS
ncbi:hypothetical protein SUNI508_13071 [Seiridium unicorne]|uniref:Uncharacterized protein n=1 Tax=Seiridium unicorne TaxID=138068 RepID=A0ABR2VEQ9_9PEZI